MALLYDSAGLKNAISPLQPHIEVYQIQPDLCTGHIPMVFFHSFIWSVSSSLIGRMICLFYPEWYWSRLRFWEMFIVLHPSLYIIDTLNFSYTLAHAFTHHYREKWLIQRKRALDCVPIEYFDLFMSVVVRSQWSKWNAHIRANSPHAKKTLVLK